MPIVQTVIALVRGLLPANLDWMPDVADVIVDAWPEILDAARNGWSDDTEQAVSDLVAGVVDPIPGVSSEDARKIGIAVAVVSRLIAQATPRKAKRIIRLRRRVN
jgi:hypothetical protein